MTLDTTDLSGTADALANPAKSPRRLAHIALRTNQIDALIDWYGAVLGAHVAHRSGRVAFLTYDDEHHRIALIALDHDDARADRDSVGHYHTAFAYDSLADLLGNHQRLEAIGIRPYRCINHGPTVSMYYADPDGNRIELQVDSFPDAASTNAWMRSDEFRRNPIGIPFDADTMIARFRAGEPEADLMRRPDRVA